MEFGSGVLDAEAPVDAGLSFVALHFEGLNLSAESLLVGETSAEATAGEDAELDLRHVQPAAMLGRVVDSRWAMRRASSAGKVWYNDALRWVLRLSRTRRTSGTSG